MGLLLETTRDLLLYFLDKVWMIYSHFGQQNEITWIDFPLSIKGHGGISIIYAQTASTSLLAQYFLCLLTVFSKISLIF